MRIFVNFPIEITSAKPYKYVIYSMYEFIEFSFMNEEKKIY